MTPHVVFVLKHAKLLFFLQQLSNTHPVRRPLLLAKDHANSGWVNPFCQMVTSFYAQHAAISSLPATILHIWKKQTKKTPFTTMWWNRCYSKHHMEMWLNNMFIFVLGTVCFFLPSIIQLNPRIPKESFKFAILSSFSILMFTRKFLEGFGH